MAIHLGGLTLGGHRGSAPAPFDALNGPVLAGPQGSHPLHAVRAETLVRPTDGPITGTFVLDHPVRVGEGITGRVVLTAADRVAARGGALRLVGLRLDEVRRSRDHRDSQGRTTHTEHWVEAQGSLFSHDAFLEPAIPPTLEAAQRWEAPFAIPAPPLGPPSAHLGESIIAWALEVRWDVPMGSDHFVAQSLPVAQHPDLLRAGVGRQGGASLLETVSVDGASIAVTSALPAMTGSEMTIRVHWPSAPRGAHARVELHRRTNAPNGEEGVVASVEIAPGDLQSGSAEARLSVPPGAAPSFDGAGLEIEYVVRVLIDRRFRPDAAIERPVAIA